jgi:hypothetical protein
MIKPPEKCRLKALTCEKLAREATDAATRIARAVGLSRRRTYQMRCYQTVYLVADALAWFPARVAPNFRPCDWRARDMREVLTAAVTTSGQCSSSCGNRHDVSFHCREI